MVSAMKRDAIYTARNCSISGPPHVCSKARPNTKAQRCWYNDVSQQELAGQNLGLPTPPPPEGARESHDGGEEGARKDEVVTREYTVNLHKLLHGWYGRQHLPSSLRLISRCWLWADLACVLVVVGSLVGLSRPGAPVSVSCSHDSCLPRVTSHFLVIDLCVLGWHAAIV